MNTKTCRKCGETKPVTEFRFHICKACHNKQTLSYYHNTEKRSKGECSNCGCFLSTSKYTRGEVLCPDCKQIRRREIDASKKENKKECYQIVSCPCEKETGLPAYNRGAEFSNVQLIYMWLENELIPGTMYSREGKVYNEDELKNNLRKQAQKYRRNGVLL